MNDLVNDLASLRDVELTPTLDVLGGIGFDLRGRGNAEARLSLAYVRDLVDADLVALASGSTALSIRDRIDNLSHRHHLAARLIADGISRAEVSYATGYAISTLANLHGDPAFSELVAHYAGLKEAVYLDVHQRLGSLGMAAVDKLQARVEHLDKVGDDELADAKVNVQRAMMPDGTLLRIAEMALDRSLAPARKAANADDVQGVGGANAGLVVNLNFAEPKREGPVVDVTPATAKVESST